MEDLITIETVAISLLEQLKRGPCNAILSNFASTQMEKCLEEATKSVERISKFINPNADEFADNVFD